jgi:carbon-monoxide dehydrogenase large subunit
LTPSGLRGEGGALPAPAAIAGAVADALGQLGVTVTDMPLTRERLWQRIRAAADLR